MADMSSQFARFQRIAGRQHGVATYTQALSVGLTRHQVRARLASAELIVVHRGVYRFPAAPRTYPQSVMAACLACGGYASHAAAGVLWKLRGFEDDPVEVTVPYGHGRAHPAVTVHRSRQLGRLDVCTFGGIPITHPARTLLDLCASAPDRAEGALNHTLLKGLTRPHLIEAVLERDGGRGRAGAERLRRYLARADAPTESELEDAFLALLRRHGLPEPVRQYPLAGGGFRLDFAWPPVRRAAEVDGRLWHTAPADRRRDRAKLRQARAEGWRVRRFYWDEIHEAGDDVVAQIASDLRAGGVEAA